MLNKSIKLGVGAVILVVILIFSACSASYEKAEYGAKNENITMADTNEMTKGFDDSYSVAAEFTEDITEEQETETDSNNEITGMKPKLIITKNINLETLNYEETIDYVKEEVNRLGGYIEHSEVEGGSIKDKGYGYRNAYYKLRIPTTQVDVFIDRVGDMGVIRSSGEEASDITMQYFDSESRLKSKQIQEERLLEILENATDLEGIIVLEKELSEVRYEIDRLTSQLRKWDNLVDYSTIYLNVSEVKETIDVVYNPTLGNRISQAFKSSLIGIKNIIENLIIFVVAAVPFFIVLGIPLIIILLIFKKTLIKRRTKTKSEEDIK